MKNFLLLLIVLITNFSLYSQISPDYSDDNRRVYWFNVGLQIVKDKETKIPMYQVIRYGTKIYYGAAYEYDRYLWEGLSNGTRISIGPFDNEEQAKFAVNLYDINKAKEDTIVLDDNGTYFWYLITIKKTQRLNSYDFERIPAQVNSGNAMDFIKLMEVSLPQDKLVIGPFATAPEAENSKRIFRLDE